MQSIYRQIIAMSTMILLLISCTNSEKKSTDTGKTIITGKILDYTPKETKVTIINEELCVDEKREILEIDSLGNFYFSFICNSKRDIRIKSNKANFLLLAFPGDSMYVEFKSGDKQFWNDIKYSGDRKNENSHITEFQKLFHNLSVSYEEINQQKSMLNENQFVHFMDSVQKESMKIVDSFTKQYPLTNTELRFINWYASEPYYYHLFLYPIDREIQVSPEYYNFQNDFLPLKIEDLAATYNVGLFTGEYFSGSIRPKFVDDNHKLIEKWSTDEELYKKEELIADSLMNVAIINYSNGEITKDLVLTYWYAIKIRNGYLHTFEHFEDFLKKEISTDFLRNSLFNYYREARSKIDNPLDGTEIVKNAHNNSIQIILDSLFTSHKGEVIIFDCWATYCGPCIANFSQMNTLIKELDKQPVCFVFFCLDGLNNKKKWNNLIHSHNVKGLHYCLNEQQADELRKLLEIKGVPHHAIFDTKGKLRKNGNIHFDKKELISMINE